jgi:hypothetical protein
LAKVLAQACRSPRSNQRGIVVAMCATAGGTKPTSAPSMAKRMFSGPPAQALEQQAAQREHVGARVDVDFVTGGAAVQSKRRLQPG